MNILKKLALGACASLMVSGLFLFGLSFGLYQLFDTPNALKSALKDSGFYQSVVGNVLQQTQKEQPTGGEGQIPTNDPEVRKVINSAISPELLQTQVEGALASVYAWLDGKTAKLEFAIRLDDTKTKLAAGLAEHVEKRTAALPVCRAGSAPQNDPFSADCRPRGVKPKQVANEVKNEIQNGEFLKETTLSASDIKTENGQTLEEQFKALPAAHQGIEWAVYCAGLLAALMAVAVVFLSASPRAGIRKVAFTLIVVGVVSAGLSGLAAYGVGRAKEYATEPLQQTAIKIAEALANDLRHWWMWYGITLAILGIGALVALHFTKSKLGSDASKPNELAEPKGEGSLNPADKNQEKQNNSQLKN